MIVICVVGGAAGTASAAGADPGSARIAWIALICSGVTPSSGFPLVVGAVGLGLGGATLLLSSRVWLLSLSLSLSCEVERMRLILGAIL